MPDPRKFNRFTPGALPGQTTAQAAQDVPQVATITRVTNTGAWFEVPVTPRYAYGPAPWGVGSYVSLAAAYTAGFRPQVGDKALIVFAGVGVEHPWVLAWTR